MKYIKKEEIEISDKRYLIIYLLSNNDIKFQTTSLKNESLSIIEDEKEIAIGGLYLKDEKIECFLEDNTETSVKNALNSLDIDVNEDIMNNIINILSSFMGKK